MKTRGRIMKSEIHPRYQKSTVTCACGNTFETRSTIPEIRVEVCAACHPFYTGKQKLVDTAGRVDRFREREQAASRIRDAKVVKSTTKAEVVTPAPETEETPSENNTTNNS
jgi:large subunit ribosomal protein L31